MLLAAVVCCCLGGGVGICLVDKLMKEAGPALKGHSLGNAGSLHALERVSVLYICNRVVDYAAEIKSRIK